MDVETNGYALNTERDFKVICIQSVKSLRESREKKEHLMASYDGVEPRTFGSLSDHLYFIFLTLINNSLSG